ncbi:MAG: YihY/virulence factor BrkB family protein [Chitinophagaceae bacterium]|nr:YihY/virulence factor BrkB family protein [Chitinophagaceae bacterium]
MKKIKSFFSHLKEAFNGFLDDNAFKLSASLSYYTIFSLAPLLIIVISLTGLFWGREAVQGEIYEEIKGFVGSGAALQIQEIIRNIRQHEAGALNAIVGVVILMIGATGVFVELQDSINFIWSVKAKPKKGWLRFLKNRLLSFSLIIGIGFLLLVSMALSAALDLLSNKLLQYFKESVYLFYILNNAIIIIVISSLFAVIFKVLPDARIRWKDAFVGALFTTALFLLGKFGISFYVSRSNLGFTYGAAASIIVLLTWVYYSSLILYFGAEFTKSYALKNGGIQPNETAVYIIKRESKEAPFAPEEYSVKETK